MAFGDYRGGGNVDDVGSTLALTATLSVTANAGDLIVAFGGVHTTSSAPTVVDNIDTAGTSWTKHVDATRSTTHRITVFSKVAVGGETAVTWDPVLSSSFAHSLDAAVFAGTFDALRFDAPAANSLLNVSATSASLSTSTGIATANELIVAGVHTAGTAGTGLFTWSGDVTERIDAGQRISMASAIKAASGATASVGVSWATARNYAIFTLAFRAPGTNLLAAADAFPTFTEGASITPPAVAGTFGQPNQVQAVVAATAGTGPISIVLATPVPAGNLLIADQRLNDAGTTPLITDNLGGTWNMDYSLHASHTMVRYSKRATGGETTFTLDPNGANAARGMIVAAFEGPFLVGSGVLDGAMMDSATGTSNAFTVNSNAGLLTDGELVVASVLCHGSAGGIAGAAFTWTGDLTERFEDAISMRASLASAVIPTAGSLPQATVTYAAASRGAVIMSAYRAFGSVVPPPPPPPPALQMYVGKLVQ